MTQFGQVFARMSVHVETLRHPSLQPRARELWPRMQVIGPTKPARGPTGLCEDNIKPGHVYSDRLKGHIICQCWRDAPERRLHSTSLSYRRNWQPREAKGLPESPGEFMPKAPLC